MKQNRNEFDNFHLYSRRLSFTKKLYVINNIYVTLTYLRAISMRKGVFTIPVPQSICRTCPSCNIYLRACAHSNFILLLVLLQYD